MARDAREHVRVRIALDARKLRDGGIGTYIRGLLGGLSAAFPHDEWTALMDPAQRGLMRWPGDVREVGVRAGKYGLAEHWRVPAAARAAGATLLHAPHYTLPMGWGGAAVVTIHDLIHVRLAHLQRPGVAVAARVLAGLAAHRAEVVIADSEATRQDVVELLHVRADKVHVVPLGLPASLAPAAAVDVAVFRSERALPVDYVLYVGARKRHKNLELLLRAWSVMAPGDRPPLVFSGAAWSPDDPLARLAHTLGVAASVRFAGDVPDDRTLACLYSGAALVVQPSLLEGFGLPPLEAMACGAPVLSSDAGSLPEVLGDAAVLLPPRDPEAWAHTTLRLLGDTAGRARLVTRGHMRAERYTWARAANATRELYSRAVSLRRR
jgi:glycosyltransferase involved in cell wall biosynthesis